MGELKRKPDVLDAIGLVMPPAEYERLKRDLGVDPASVPYAPKILIDPRHPDFEATGYFDQKMWDDRRAEQREWDAGQGRS